MTKFHQGRFTRLALMGALTLFMIGCGPRDTSEPVHSETGASSAEAVDSLKISGTFTYLADKPLPENSVAIVQVNDVTSGYGDAFSIADEMIDLTGRTVPIAYEIAVPKSSFESGHTYALRADIYIINQTFRKVIWATDRIYRVDPSSSNPLEMPEIILIRIEADK